MILLDVEPTGAVESGAPAPHGYRVPISVIEVLTGEVLARARLSHQFRLSESTSSQIKLRTLSSRQKRLALPACKGLDVRINHGDPSSRVRHLRYLTERIGSESIFFLTGRILRLTVFGSRGPGFVHALLPYGLMQQRVIPLRQEIDVRLRQNRITDCCGPTAFFAVENESCYKQFDWQTLRPDGKRRLPVTFGGKVITVKAIRVAFIAIRLSADSLLSSRKNISPWVNRMLLRSDH
ncbi:hypothetical protein EVAR_103560_1 [Eumeta japonica]|uniref:Uncharacterized protein n=1 Tax=Eumeta variegata TaxID=151549 RepID=A0A4C1YF31_EUMVA|nr:hypothetical protein EVAR_103560_1 [Eumeta japonica]